MTQVELGDLFFNKYPKESDFVDAFSNILLEERARSDYRSWDNWKRFHHLINVLNEKFFLPRGRILLEPPLTSLKGQESFADYGVYRVDQHFGSIDMGHGPIPVFTVEDPADNLKKTGVSLLLTNNQEGTPPFVCINIKALSLVRSTALERVNDLRVAENLILLDLLRIHSVVPKFSWAAHLGLIGGLSQKFDEWLLSTFTSSLKGTGPLASAIPELIRPFYQLIVGHVAVNDAAMWDALNERLKKDPKDLQSVFLSFVQQKFPGIQNPDISGLDWKSLFARIAEKAWGTPLAPEIERWINSQTVPVEPTPFYTRTQDAKRLQIENEQRIDFLRALRMFAGEMTPSNKIYLIGKMNALLLSPFPREERFGNFLSSFDSSSFERFAGQRATPEEFSLWNDSKRFHFLLDILNQKFFIPRGRVLLEPQDPSLPEEDYSGYGMYRIQKSFGEVNLNWREIAVFLH